MYEIETLQNRDNKVIAKQHVLHTHTHTPAMYSDKKRNSSKTTSVDLFKCAHASPTQMQEFDECLSEHEKKPPLNCFHCVFIIMIISGVQNVPSVL